MTNVIGVNLRSKSNPRKVKINIDWCRHAESCGNLDQDSHNDREINVDRNIGYLPIVEHHSPIAKHQSQTDTTGWLSVSYDAVQNASKTIMAAVKYHPNLSFIGLQHGILLGRDYIRKDKKKYDCVLSSMSLRTIMTALLAFRGTDTVIFVIPFISETVNIAGQVDYQNMPLDSNKLKRMVKFIKDWFVYNIPNNIDDIEFIEILTSMKKKIINKYREEIDTHNTEPHNQCLTMIETILACKTSIVQEKMDDYKRNEITKKCYNIYKKNIDLIKQIIHENQELQNTIQSEYMALKKFTDPIFLAGPPVNFTILENFEKLSRNIDDSKLCSDYDKFYNFVLPLLFNNGLRDQEKNVYNIFCSTHGNVIRKNIPEYCKIDKCNMENYYNFKGEPKYKDHMYNTQIVEQIIEYSDVENYVYPGLPKTLSVNFEKFLPQKIREEYENFEIFNIDICRIQSLKCVINYPLFYNNPSTISSASSTLEWGKSFLTDTTDRHYPDVEFYINNDKDKYFDAKIYDESEFKGGNSDVIDKYIKLKNKIY